GALHRQLGVAPAVPLVLLLVPARARAARRRRVGLADIDPAGESDPAVDHRDLAVVAVIDALDAFHRVELAHGDTGVAQLLEVGFRGVDRSHAVVHQVDLDAAL